MTAGAAVTVVVVSWNTRDLLLRCLASLAPDAEAGRVTVVVVDNGSTDGSMEAAQGFGPWVQAIDTGGNLGFGRAVNLAARDSRGEWLVAANADVALERGALQTLLDAGADRRVGCIAPRLVLPEGQTQHSVFPFPTVPFTLAFNLGLQHLRPRWGARQCLVGFWDPDEPRDVPWAIGALLLLRRAAFDEVGGFNEAQWMYAEDLDLGWRLHEAGWRTRYEPEARVLHAQGAATSAAFGADTRKRFMAATYATLMRRRGPIRTWVTAALNVAGTAVRWAWWSTAKRISPRFQTRAADTRGWLVAHRSGLRGRQALLLHADGSRPAPTP